MAEQLDVKTVAAWVPACPTGRHVPVHPDMTCDEADEWITARDARLDAWLDDPSIEALHRILAEDPPATFTGLLAVPMRDPTPMDRALAILAPELARCPLYRS